MIVTTSGAVIWSTGEHGTAGICLKKPVECPRCHRMVCLVVNREGKTLCVVCDGETKRAEAE